MRELSEVDLFLVGRDCGVYHLIVRDAHTSAAVGEPLFLYLDENGLGIMDGWMATQGVDFWVVGEDERAEEKALLAARLKIIKKKAALETELARLDELMVTNKRRTEQLREEGRKAA
jgi:hypothetical protein